MTFLTTKQQILKHNSSPSHKKNKEGDDGKAEVKEKRCYNLSSPDGLDTGRIGV